MADQVALLNTARTALEGAGSLTGATTMGGSYTWAQVIVDFEDHINKVEGARDGPFHKLLTTFYDELTATIVANP